MCRKCLILSGVLFLPLMLSGIYSNGIPIASLAQTFLGIGSGLIIFAIIFWDKKASEKGKKSLQTNSSIPDKEKRI